MSPSATSSPVAVASSAAYRSLAETYGSALRDHFTFTDSAFEPRGPVGAGRPAAFTVRVLGANAARATLTFDVVQAHRLADADPVVRNRFTYVQTSGVTRGLQVIVFGDAAPNFRTSNVVAGGMTTVDFATFVCHYREVAGSGPVWLGLDEHGRIDLIAVPFHP